MSAVVNVLVVGRVEYNNKNYHCWPTVVLIRENMMNIVVDPGTVKQQSIITEALKENGLSKDDITHVFITHSHLDHYRNIGMFPNATSVDYWGNWEEDRLVSNEWTKEAKFSKGNFSDNIHVVKTPGHDYSSLSFLVRGRLVYLDQEVAGVVGICGDVFWRDGYPDLNNMEDESYATDKLVLESSRKLILDNSDYIIPGHGDVYRVNKNNLV